MPFGKMPRTELPVFRFSSQTTDAQEIITHKTCRLHDFGGQSAAMRVEPGQRKPDANSILSLQTKVHCFHRYSGAARGGNCSDCHSGLGICDLVVPAFNRRVRLCRRFTTRFFPPPLRNWLRLRPSPATQRSRRGKCAQSGCRRTVLANASYPAGLADSPGSLPTARGRQLCASTRRVVDAGTAHRAAFARRFGECDKSAPFATVRAPRAGRRRQERHPSVHGILPRNLNWCRLFKRPARVSATIRASTRNALWTERGVPLQAPDRFESLTADDPYRA